MSREILFLAVKSIRVDVVEGFDPLLQLIVTERCGKFETETSIALQFDDGPPELAVELSNAVNVVMEKYRPSLNGTLLKFVKRREPA